MLEKQGYTHVRLNMCTPPGTHTHARVSMLCYVMLCYTYVACLVYQYRIFLMHPTLLVLSLGCRGCVSIKFRPVSNMSEPSSIDKIFSIFKKSLVYEKAESLLSRPKQPSKFPILSQKIPDQTSHYIYARSTLILFSYFDLRWVLKVLEPRRI